MLLKLLIFLLLSFHMYKEECVSSPFGKNKTNKQKMCRLTSQWKNTKIACGYLRGPNSVSGIRTLLPSCCCSCSYQTPRQSEGKRNLCHTMPHIFTISTKSHFNRLTSKIFFSLVDDLMDMDAEMTEFSCYGRWSEAQNQQRQMSLRRWVVPRCGSTHRLQALHHVGEVAHEGESVQSLLQTRDPSQTQQELVFLGQLIHRSAILLVVDQQL